MDIKGTIIQICDETPNVKSFSVKIEEKIDYKAAQFFMLGFPNLTDENGAVIKRAFSVASSPTEENILFTAKLKEDGIFTNHLFSKSKVGDEIILDGPYGHFVFDDEVAKKTKRVVLIASGSGVAPMRAFLKDILAKYPSILVELYFTSRHPEDIIYHEELVYLDGNVDNFNLYLYLTQPNDSWIGGIGRFDADKVREVIKVNSDDVFFLCGQIQMVNTTKEVLMELGVKKEQLKFEAW